MKRLSLILFIYIGSLSFLRAQEYNASLFGCVSDGVTNNTSSIQYAIDFLSEKGGGKLNFYVGRYLTGGITLKSNVTIVLHEGAVLLASPSVYDYLKHESGYALLLGENVSNVSIIGQGVIEGQAIKFADNLNKLQKAGVIEGQADQRRPALLSFTNANQVTIDGILLMNASSDVQRFTETTNVVLRNQIIKSKSYTQSNGIVLKDTKGVSLSNIYIETTNKPIVKEGNTEVILLEKCITSNGKPAL